MWFRVAKDRQTAGLIGVEPHRVHEHVAVVFLTKQEIV